MSDDATIRRLDLGANPGPGKCDQCLSKPCACDEPEEDDVDENPGNVVGTLKVDARSGGPWECHDCGEELDKVDVLDDGSITCPHCWEPFIDNIHDLSPDQFVVPADAERIQSMIKPPTKDRLKVGPTKSNPKKGTWIIEWTEDDSSRDTTVAYDTKEEAIEIAAEFAAKKAHDELTCFEWDDDEAVEMLEEVIKLYEEKDPVGAIKAWLDYQNEYDPDERIAIGPSGSVSDRATDFSW